LRGEINTASVLSAPIVALTVQGGGVVNGKKDFEQHSDADDRGVVSEENHFIVARHDRANLLIGWIQCLYIALARFNIEDTPDLDKHRFGAPKATAAKDNGFKISRLSHEGIVCQIKVRLLESDCKPQSKP